MSVRLARKGQRKGMSIREGSLRTWPGTAGRALRTASTATRWIYPSREPATVAGNARANPPQAVLTLRFLSATVAGSRLGSVRATVAGSRQGSGLRMEAGL